MTNDEAKVQHKKLKDRIIVALDVADAGSGKDLVDRLYPTVKIFKVGSQLFTTSGQEVINHIKRKGGSCFLDLKFHDIPATVKKAAEAATALGVDIFNVHASGGPDMIKMAVKGAQEAAERFGKNKPMILGVTVLTSMDAKDLKAIGIKKGLDETVISLAGLAKTAGLDGVVASANEIKMIKKEFGDDFVVITPGIRPKWAEKADQKRSATPAEAFDRGADYIVIGRPITGEPDPKAAAERIINKLEAG